MKKRLLVAALAAAPLVSVAAGTSAHEAVAAAQGPALSKASKEQVAQMKQRVLSQIAVYDAAEKAMRRPSTQEAAALVLPTGPSTATITRLPNGGMAYQPDVSRASLAVARRGEDGKVTWGHHEKAPADATKEPRHDR